jgi:hypothetical protein
MTVDVVGKIEAEEVLRLRDEFHRTRFPNLYAANNIVLGIVDGEGPITEVESKRIREAIAQAGLPLKVIYRGGQMGQLEICENKDNVLRFEYWEKTGLHRIFPGLSQTEWDSICADAESLSIVEVLRRIIEHDRAAQLRQNPADAR